MDETCIASSSSFVTASKNNCETFDEPSTLDIIRQILSGMRTGVFTWLLKAKGKVHPCTALRFCTCRTAHRGSRCIALLFYDHGTRKRVRGQRHAPAVLYPRGRHGTHCTGGWVGPRVGLDRCGKSRTRRSSIPGRSSP